MVLEQFEKNSIGIKHYADIIVEALVRLCGPLDPDTLAVLLDHVQLFHLNVGETLYRQGDEGTSMHIVLTGRLKVQVFHEEGGLRTLAHPQPGEVVGEMALLTGSTRAATVMALRDSTLGVLQRQDLDALMAKYPSVFSRVAQMIINRLSGAQSHIAQRTGTRTIMLVPINKCIDRVNFGRALRHALLPFGSVMQLDSRSVTEHLSSSGNVDYGRFLDDCERSNDYVILEADAEPSSWTRKCYGYADRIVLVADASTPPEVTQLESWLFEATGRNGAYAEVELVLVHREITQPEGTREWLKLRKLQRYQHVCINDESSMGRLARFLSGNAVALVLAGGGARGFAHLGVIRALREIGIPIDAVGGASFGALAATGVARGLEDEQVLEESREVFTRDNPLGDYTLPIISLVRGERLDRLLRKYLPMDIEDLWLPFFAVSSDISTNQIHIHDSGPLWRAIRASVSLPAILPPALEAGHLLIDGGVLNNLPVDVMRDRIRGHVIAVDLAVDQEYKLDRESIPGGIEYLKSRLLPGRTPIEAPTLSQVIMKLTTLASHKEMENIRRLADLYLNPKLGAYDFLDWESLREIVDIGYTYALPRIEQWMQEHRSLVDRRGFTAAWLKDLAET